MSPTATEKEGPKMDNDNNSSNNNDNKNDDIEDYNKKTTEKGLPPRKWLYDRIYGRSKLGDSHPPCPICWVPPPVGLCPNVIEESFFCRRWGRIGLVHPENERARFWILHIGFIANIIGFLLTMYSCFAISLDANILKAASFSSADVSGPVLDDFDTSIRIELGLRGGLVEFPFMDEPLFLVGFDELCDLPDDSLKTFFSTKSDSDCNACSEVSDSMVFSVIFSVITFIPSFSTDILRMYSNYDVNCQKGFSTLFASLALLLSINTLVKYNQTCFAAFYSGTIPLDEQLQPITNIQQQKVFVNATFQWSMGPGLICLYIGTLLKAFDIASNLAVPSPIIARDRKLQWEYEIMAEAAAAAEKEKEKEAAAAESSSPEEAATN